MTTPVNYDNKQKQLIHQLIDTLFTSDTLDDFITTHFPEVAEQVTLGAEKGTKIQTLIEDCARRKRLGQLVAHIQQEKPADYEAFVERTRAQPSPAPPESDPPPTEARRDREITTTSIKPVRRSLIHDPKQYLDQLLEERYRLDEILDQTGLGAVFKAYDTKLERDVAIKIIDPERVRQPAMLERVRQEVQTAMRLEHPGIVQIYDFGRTDSLLYIIMEYIAGENLADVRQRFSALSRKTILPEILRLVRQICLTVDYMHHQGVLHPGTKPENIMLKPGQNDGETLQPVLINLGLLRPNREAILTHEQISARRLTYTVSPELLLGHATDIRSDVYAIGIILYDLLAGRPPFRPKDLAEATRLHIEEAPPSLRAIHPEVPEAIEQIVMKALAKDPADRYLSAKGLAQALAEQMGLVVAEPAAVAQPEPARAEVAITVAAPQLVATPGQGFSTAIILHNRSQTEDYVQVKVRGIPADWVAISPAATTLSPGEREEVELTIQPPLSSLTRAGRHPLTLQVVSDTHPDQMDEIQTVLTIAPYSQFQASLWPQEITAGQITQVTIDNQGNVPEVFTVLPSEEEDLLIEPDQARLRLEPGEEQTVDFRVAPRRQYVVSEAKTYTFSFQVSNAQGLHDTLSGQVTSRGQVQPVWVLVAVVAIVFILCTAAAFYPILFPSDNILEGTAAAQRATLEAATAQIITNQTAIIATSTAQAAIGEQGVTATAAWQSRDEDQDGLTNGEEQSLGTDPANKDTDNDGLFDGDEVKRFNTSPFNPDSDYDGIIDSEEVRLNLDPLSRDTDLDGTPDSTDEDPGRIPTPTSTITPNPVPIVRFSNTAYFVDERDGQATITVVLDVATDRPVSVDYVTSSNSASAGSDFTSVGGTLVFNPGQTVQTFIVPLVDDNVREPEESLSLTLANTQNANLGVDSRATLSILDDDEPISIRFSEPETLFRLPRYEVNENQSRATIEVLLSTAVPNNQQIRVDYATNDSSALAGQDYRAAAGTLIFNPGQTRQSFVVDIIDDNSDEGDETVTLTLSNPVGANIDTPRADLVIIDD